MCNDDRYIPALSFARLTPLYDPVMKWVMREDRFKRHLVAQATVQPGHQVLDLGCGTATLAIAIKQRVPDAHVVGLDGDAEVLSVASAKARQGAVQLPLMHGMAFHLPFPAKTFDRVLASLVLHHLTPTNKHRTLCEVERVLRPAGELHVVDVGKPHTALAYLISLGVRQFEETADQIQGYLPALFREAGFAHIMETAQYLTVVGTLSLFKVRKLS
jgi:ubiquinone/menaquinone biosynthesis C-methylase UbiE